RAAYSREAVTGLLLRSGRYRRIEDPRAAPARSPPSERTALTGNLSQTASRDAIAGVEWVEMHSSDGGSSRDHRSRTVDRAGQAPAYRDEARVLAVVHRPQGDRLSVSDHLVRSEHTSELQSRENLVCR